MPLLHVSQLSKSYTDHPAVDDLSFQLAEGEILALIGKSGSGKSTLIRMIAGLVEPDKGEIRFENQILEGPSKKLVPGHEEIRLVHQDFQLKHKMTVAENIRYELLAYKKNYQQERIEQLLSLCRIGHLKDQDIALISGGEKQRVAIARAMATEPNILLLDEPFSNLDINTKYVLLSELQSIAKTEHTAILLITHDARDAMEIADRMIVMENGTSLREGTPKEIHSDPQSREVAQLMGLFNEFTPSELEALEIPSEDQSGNVGIWAEDIELESGNVKASVVNSVFSGPYNRIRLATVGPELWAFDFTKKIKPSQEIQINIRPKHFFQLNEH